MLQSQSAPTRDIAKPLLFSDLIGASTRHHSAERSSGPARLISLSLKSPTTTHSALHKLPSSSPQQLAIHNVEVAPVTCGARLRPKLASSSFAADLSASQQVSRDETSHISLARRQRNPVL